MMEQNALVLLAFLQMETNVNNAKMMNVHNVLQIIVINASVHSIKTLMTYVIIVYHIVKCAILLQHVKIVLMDFFSNPIAQHANNFQNKLLEFTKFLVILVFVWEDVDHVIMLEAVLNVILDII